MLTDIIPLVVKLEIAKGAPFVDISLCGLSGERGLISPKPCRTMQPKRRNKKNSTRSETSGAPLAPPVKPQATPNNIVVDKSACVGQRKYSEVVVESIKPERSAGSSATRGVVSSSSQSSVSTVSVAKSVSDSVPDKLSYYCGNPSVEKTTGLLHFYKQTGIDVVLDEEIIMLCMLGIPATITCQDVVDFVTPMMDNIAEMKIIRDSTPNQYMVLFKMKSHEAACSLYDDYNGIPFWTFNETLCRLVFVERVESISADDGGSLPFSSLTELPTCTVCLERMDDDVLTILCNHSFHAKCLKQWTDYTCPVCRYLQTPPVTEEQTCNDCIKTTDLWMCLICGNIGCGRYAEAHAYQHFLKTQHTFTIELGGEKVWDYAGDSYVHRLVQVGPNGNKMAELEGSGCGRDENKGKDQVAELQVEYTCLLTKQLETQRCYYEEKLRKMEEKYSTEETLFQKKLHDLKVTVEESQLENNKLKKEIKESSRERATLDKKSHQMSTKMEKLHMALGEERTVSCMLRRDITNLHSLVQKQNDENTAARDRWTKRAHDLQEQIDDLMMHFKAAQQLSEHLGAEACNGASVRCIPSTSGTAATKSTRETRRKGGKK